MPLPDWIRMGYLAGAIVALVAAMAERRRNDRMAMLVCLICALVLLVAGRFYTGGVRLFDCTTSVLATFLGTGLLANASLRPRGPRA
jgi:CHASE2 domain-containing sensor protein